MAFYVHKVTESLFTLHLVRKAQTLCRRLASVNKFQMEERAEADLCCLRRNACGIFLQVLTLLTEVECGKEGYQDANGHAEFGAPLSPCLFFTSPSFLSFNAIILMMAFSSKTRSAQNPLLLYKLDNFINYPHTDNL